MAYDPGDGSTQSTGKGVIDTLEGPHIVSPGDWIITGVKGEKYPCKPDIFEATYESAEQPTLVPHPDALQHAFNLAEEDTANEFEGRTCSLLNRHGEETCPICYFRARVHERLRLLAAGAERLPGF